MRLGIRIFFVTFEFDLKISLFIKKDDGMKMMKIKTLAFALCASFMFSSCIGSFALWHSVLDWNQKTTNNKFVNELIFVALNIVPVYSIAAFADVVVFNSIEFWTGENPVVTGEISSVQTDNGNYSISRKADGYIITKEDGQQMELSFDTTTQTWSVESDNQVYPLLSIQGDGTAILHQANGMDMAVTMDANGVSQAQGVLSNLIFAAN